MSKPMRKMLSLALTAAMVLSLLPGFTAFAVDSGKGLGTSSIITDFAPLAPEVSEQTVPLGTSMSALTLPGTLLGTLLATDAVPGLATDSDAEDEIEETLEETLEETDIAISGVTWQSEPEYRPDTPGTYTFTSVLPQRYDLADGVSTPVIEVTVTPGDLSLDCDGSISGMLWLDMFEDIDGGIYMGDGARQAEEQPLAGYTVSLYAESDTASAAQTTTTGADGSYSFTGLQPGRYVIGVATEFMNGTEYLLPLWYLDGTTGDNRFAAAYNVAADAYLNAYTAPIEIGAGTAVTGMNAGVRTPPGIMPLAANVPYLDASGQQQTCLSATDLTGGGVTTLTGGWYLASGTLDYTGTITVYGDVHLILKDGCDLTVTGDAANAGIFVTGANSLTIYAQSTGTNMGALTAESGSGNYGAGIGGGNAGNHQCGTITINGGRINATGGDAGIGGGFRGSGGDITINGGTVTATGGSYGAGIGGGSAGDGGNIKISGGTVTATGSGGSTTGGGAGIGGGTGSAGGNIKISGGTITATGGGSGYDGAGIGGGYGGGGNITINGGTVNAIGGGNGAGIGGGSTGAGGNITINGGNITATGGGSGAGIGGGGGWNGGGNILIYGENTTVTAKRGTSGSPQDIGAGHSGAAGNVFVALPQGSLLGTGNAEIGNPVAFTASPASTGTVTATLPTPFDAAGAIGILSSPNTMAKNLSVITTFGGSDNIDFALAGGYISPVVKTGTELMTSGAAVDFSSVKALTISGGTIGTDYTYVGNVLNITAGGTYIITMAAGVTTTTIDSILVSTGVTANITLNDVSIDVSGTIDACAFDMTGATVNLTLAGTNTLKSGRNRAGLQAPSGAALTIAGNGSLTATGGGMGGAGIGGGYGDDGGNITISGGTVTATGNWGSAGIGGGYGGNGYGGSGGNITISGGTVTATGGSYGAGIGGGIGDGGNILIYGENTTVTAKRGNEGSPQDIGAGNGGAAGYVFVALPQGKLTLSNTPSPTPNTVAFTADPASSGTVTATLPAPFNAVPFTTGGVYNLLTGIDTAGKTFSVITTFTTENVSFALAGGYTNSPISMTGTALMASGATVAFVIPPTYGITLSQTGTHTFTGKPYGYTSADITPLTVTVANTGNQPTGTLTVSLSGTNSSSFSISANSAAAGIAVSGTATFKVAPNTGLNAGTYSATVNVTGGNGISASFNVSFAVGAAAQQALTINGLSISYTYGDAAFSLSTSGGSGGGAVSYTSSDSAVASVQNGVPASDQETVTIHKAGTFTITATKAADSNYNAASVTSAMVTVSTATPNVSFTATGGANVATPILLTATVSAVGTGATPAGTVTFSEGSTTLGTETLVSGEAAFTVNNPAAGSHTYTATYNGQTDYYNANSTQDTIGVGLADQTGFVITDPGTKTYGGSDFTLTTTGGQSTGGVSFSVPANNVLTVTSGGAVTIIGAGNVTVTAAKAADSNYNQATATLGITVQPRDIGNVTVTVLGGPHVYTGSQLQPVFDVSDGGIAITSGDYTNIYGANIDAGTNGGSVTLAGQGNYTGTKTVNFDIEPRSLTGAVITLAPEPYVYAGSAVTPAVTSVVAGGVAVPASEYDVGYANNTGVGTAAVTVTAKTASTNFAGSESTTFTITAPTTYALTITAGTGGSITAGTSGQYAQGAVINISASPNRYYRFSGWTSSNGGSFGNVNSASTTFTMPGDATTITANFTYTGGSSSSGDSSGSYTSPIIYPVEVTAKPDFPTTARLTLSQSPDKNNALTYIITKEMVQQALDKAKEEAEKQVRESYGYALEFDFSTTANIDSLNITFNADALALLESTGIKETTVTTNAFRFSFDLTAIKEMNKQSGGRAVTVSASRFSELSDDAKRLIGSRPVWDITISYKNSDKTEYILNLDKGFITMGMKYTPTSTEETGNLAVVYVPGSGKPQILTKSSYNGGWMIWQRISLSVYGVGYITPDHKITYAEIESE